MPHLRSRRTSAASVDAIADLTICRNVSAVYGVALERGAALVMPHDEGVSVSVVAVQGGSWQQVMTTRALGDGLRGAGHLLGLVAAEFGAAGTHMQAGRESERAQNADRHLTMVPLQSVDELLAVLVVDSLRTLPLQTAGALTKLARQVSMALEAVTLREEVRQLRKERLYRALLDNSNDAVLVIDHTGRPLFASPAADRLLAASGQHSDVFHSIHPLDRPAFVSMVNHAPQALRAQDGQQVLECRVVRTGGPARWIEATATDMSLDPDIGGVVINIHDVTERKMVENDIRHRVLHDDVTGIPNKALLRERADHALSMRRSEESVAAVLFIGIDDFEVVAGRLGDVAGDDILKIIAFRLDNFVRGHDTAARLDEHGFAVLLQDVASDRDVHGVASRLLGILQRPIDFDGREVSLDIRIGVAKARPDYDSGTWLRNANVALNEARLTAGRIAVYSDTMSVSAVDRLELRRDLEQAIVTGQLLLNYQPVFALDRQEVAGFEALVRWVHPTRGPVSPAAFIPLAEETGLISPIGLWIIENACRQLAEWREWREDLDLHMNVNVSVVQLFDGEFVDAVARVLRETEVPPAALTLELTATDDLDVPAVRDNLARLHDLGVGIAADDFGSGFAAYAARDELPFTVAKIDRSLVVGLDTNLQKATRQLRTVIDMARAAGLQVEAEGIEDAVQRDLLTSLGCDRAQGYFFGRPVAAEEAAQYLAEEIQGAHVRR